MKTILKLGPADAGTLVSADDFAGAEFQEPFTYERVRGRLVVMSPAGPEHRQVSREFRRLLGLYWGQHAETVDDVDVEGWVVTSDDDDRIPDICVYLAGPNSGQTVPRRVPDLIFEFVSQDRADQERDYIDKRAEYHAIGVKEYVIVDRFKRAALVLTWRSGGFAERTLSPADAYTTPLLPGLKVPLGTVFSEPGQDQRDRRKVGWLAAEPKAKPQSEFVGPPALFLPPGALTNVKQLLPLSDARLDPVFGNG